MKRYNLLIDGDWHTAYLTEAEYKTVAEVIQTRFMPCNPANVFIELENGDSVYIRRIKDAEQLGGELI